MVFSSKKGVIATHYYVNKSQNNYCAKSLQSCPTLCDSMDCSPPGSSVHGTPQARMLEWVSRPSSRGSSWPRTEARPPALQVDSSLSEPPGRPPRRSYHGTHLRLRCKRKLLAAGPLGPQTKVILNIWQPLPLAFKPGHTPNNSEWPCFITPWPALAITQLLNVCQSDTWTKECPGCFPDSWLYSTDLSAHPYLSPFLSHDCFFSWASQVAQWWAICLLLRETQEAQVPSLGQEDPLEEGAATHSSTLAWEIPWTEEPGGL